jgi:hypothetical protein
VVSHRAGSRFSVRRTSMNRPPAYQCYASDLLANERYFQLSASGRGLYQSICLACWVNDTVPAEPKDMAVSLRLNVQEVERELPAVIATGWVVPSPSNSTRLHVPLLTEQMQRMLGKRVQQAIAGAKGGTRAQRRAAEARSYVQSSRERSSDRSSTLRREEPNREEQRRKEVCSDRRTPMNEDQRAWLEDYERSGS